MERFFRNIKLFTMTMIALFVTITGVMVLFSLLADPKEQPVNVSSAEETSSADVVEEKPDDTTSVTSSNDDEASLASSLEEVSEPEKPLPKDEQPTPETTAQGAKRGLPEDMRAVCLTPGTDYATQGDETQIRAGVAAAIASAKTLSMNAVVVEVGTASPLGTPDPLQIVLEEARAQDMYVYALYQAKGEKTGGIDMSLVDLSAQTAGELARRYTWDGFLIENCGNETSPDSYASYITSHAAIGYRESMQSYSTALFGAVSGAVHENAEGTLVGLVANGVWENAARNKEGSATTATSTMLYNDNADAKRWVENGLADFVVLRPGGTGHSAAEPLGTVSKWWSALAQKNDLPFYVLHPTQTSAPDALTQQVIYARECENFKGSMFDSLSSLVSNAQGSTDLLLRLYRNEVRVDHVLTQLAITKPDKSTFASFEPVMAFRGASDPNFEVKLNGTELETDDNGYFTITMDLKPGENIFTFEHKGKSQVFKITRNVQIVQEVSPSGNVAVEGGMRVEVTALAYADATVSASIGGASIPMQRDTSIDDSTDAGSAYARFTGSFQAPAATSQKQALGTISVSGNWQGVSDTKQGASVSVNAVVPAGDGQLVIVTAESAKTFPNDVLNNESNPNYFSLPKGTKDYAVSDALTFVNDSDTYQFYKLQSGMRVYAQDVSKTSGELSLGNAISSMSITGDKRYTYVALKTRDPVPYLVQYAGSNISFNFQYTTSVPESQKVTDNPAISAAEWSGSKLTLKFTRAGSFVGYHAYYQEDELILRLTNPPNSMGGVRIAIDPGHGGKDRGAPGYYPDVSEAQVNLAIAQKTAQALKNAGANVKLIQTDPYLTLTQRIDAARSFDADIFISIHANSSESNAAATGTEVFYFYPNGQALAGAVSGQVAGALDTSNRGAKQAAYVVTTDSRFTSILVETGFISSKPEYKKLTSDAYQSKIANGIVSAVSGYVQQVSTGIAGGNHVKEEEPKKDAESDSKSEETDSIELSLPEKRITLEIGEEYQLEPKITPSDADVKLEYVSDDESIVTVDSNGFVQAIKTGRANVTVYVADEDGSTAKIRITVEEE